MTLFIEWKPADPILASKRERLRKEALFKSLYETESPSVLWTPRILLSVQHENAEDGVMKETISIYHKLCDRVCSLYGANAHGRQIVIY